MVGKHRGDGAIKTEERDSQKSKVYAAEHRAWLEVCAANPKLAKLNQDRTIEEAGAIVRQLAERKRVTDKYPKAARLTRVRFTRGVNGGTAHYYEHRISLGVWARRTHYVMLHEAAHLLVPAAVKHGWQFAECHLHLWRQVYGVEAAQVLERQYKAHKVRYRQPRAKRELTPEQRAVLVERLAAARAARPPAAPQPEKPLPYRKRDGELVCAVCDDYYHPCPVHFPHLLRRVSA